MATDVQSSIAGNVNSISAALRGVPGPVAQAIENASQTYGVPADLLAGIWRTESGSSYPNPYANGLGYGGEFGTQITTPFGSAQQVERVTEPPVQQQANTAASILENLLQQTHGDISSSLSQYSGGGYTSVPGETTFGTDPSYSQAYLNKGGIPGGTATAAPPIPNQVGSAAGSAITGAASDISKGLGLNTAFSFLTSWRFAEVIGGVLLLLLGLLLLGKQFGLGATPPAAVARLAPGL